MYALSFFIEHVQCFLSLSIFRLKNGKCKSNVVSVPLLKNTQLNVKGITGFMKNLRDKLFCLFIDLVFHNIANVSMGYHNIFLQ